MAKVAKQIEREIGTMLLFDRRLQEAVCPERRLGVDNAVSGLASVTEVVLSGDLQVRRWEGGPGLRSFSSQTLF